MALCSVAGPAANFLLAVGFLVILKLLLTTPFGIHDDNAALVFTPLLLMMKAGVIMNVVFAAFNLLPIPPLDGGRVLMGLLPWRQAAMLEKIEPYGFLIILALVATGLSSYIIEPMISVLMAALRLFL
jgi:Zn-dependent protease